MHQLDLIVIGEPRLEGAEGRSLAAFLRVATGCGYHTAFLPLGARRQRSDLAWHPHLDAVIKDGVVWLQPNETAQCRLAILWNGTGLARVSPRQLPIAATRVILRVDQLPRNRVSALVATAAVLLGQEPEIVPSDPSLTAPTPGASSWSEGTALLPPTVVPLRSDVRYRETVRVVGRHGIEGGFSLAAPPPCEVRLAEAAARATASVITPATNCHRIAGTLDEDRSTFLSSLDGYALLPGPGQRPWVGAAVAEALAAGIPVCGRLDLPDGVVFEAGDLAAFVALPADERHRHAEAGLSFAARHLGPEAVAARLEALLGAPGPRPGILKLRRGGSRPTRSLFLTPNGIGMGHLTRLLAVARRLDRGHEAVFLSMSQAVGLVERFGWIGEYFSYHLHTGETVETWNRALALRLAEAIAFYDPRLVVFDGNVPYQGLVEARNAFQDRPFVWIRRGMWRAEAGRATIDRVRHFDLAIEPGELAEEDDPGVTAGRRHEVVRVPPITLVGAEEVLDRETARAELGLDPGCTAVIVQLGSRNNFDYAEIDRVLHDELDPRPEVHVVHLDWLIGEAVAAEPARRTRRIQLFPAIRHIRAFDVAVSGAGYNSFHELLALGVPTVFVPNEHPTMDAQEVRALWAERRGLAFCVRAAEPYRMSWALRALLDPDQRAAMGRRLDACRRDDGATVTARYLDELAGTTWLRAKGARIARSRSRFNVG